MSPINRQKGIACYFFFLLFFIFFLTVPSVFASYVYNTTGVESCWDGWICNSSFASQIITNSSNGTITYNTSAVGRTNLLGEWLFNYDNSTHAIDTSGQGNNGTISGATANLGKYGVGYSFDGINDYILATDVSNLNAPTVMSVSAWINPSATGFTGHIISKYRSAVSDGWMLRLITANNVSFDITGSGSETYVTDATSIPVGEWRHVVAVFNSTATPNKVKIYVNGTEVSVDKTGSSTLLTASPTALSIGYIPVDGQYFSGSIDEGRVWNRTLSATEVLALYNTSPHSISANMTTTAFGTNNTFMVNESNKPTGTLWNAYYNATNGTWVQIVNGGVSGTLYNITGAYEGGQLRIEFQGYTNNSVEIMNVTVNQDLTIPIHFINISSPLNTTYTNVITVNLNVSGYNYTSWLYTLNSGANTSFTPNTTIATYPGHNILTVWGLSSALNSSKSVAFTMNYTFNITVLDEITYAPVANVSVEILDNETYHREQISYTNSLGQVTWADETGDTKVIRFGNVTGNYTYRRTVKYNPIVNATANINVYLTPVDEVVVYPCFQILDYTGTFIASNSELTLRRMINSTLQDIHWSEVNEDNKVCAYLIQDVPYAITLENTDGDSYNYGYYRPSYSETIVLQVSNVDLGLSYYSEGSPITWNITQGSYIFAMGGPSTLSIIWTNVSYFNASNHSQYLYGCSMAGPISTCIYTSNDTCVYVDIQYNYSATNGVHLTPTKCFYVTGLHTDIVMPSAWFGAGFVLLIMGVVVMTFNAKFMGLGVLMAMGVYVIAGIAGIFPITVLSTGIFVIVIVVVMSIFILMVKKEAKS